jgi:hypothetical protein
MHLQMNKAEAHDDDENGGCGRYTYPHAKNLRPEWSFLLWTDVGKKCAGTKKMGIGFAFLSEEPKANAHL